MLYDELKVITSIDVEILKDIAFPYIVNLKLDIDKKFSKAKPTRTSLDLDKRDYKKFLTTFGLTLMEVKTLLNDVVMIDGVAFPFSVDEIFTTVGFFDKDNSMHIFMEIEDSAAEFFEKEWWDDKKYNDQKERTATERAKAQEDEDVDGGPPTGEEREELAEEAAREEEDREEAREKGKAEEERQAREKSQPEDEEVPEAAENEENEKRKKEAEEKA